MPGRPVAFPAFELLEEFASVQDAFDGHRRLGWNHEHVAGFLFGPAWRPGLDKGDQVGALLLGQRLPGGHVGVNEAAGDRVVEILVGG